MTDQYLYDVKAITSMYDGDSIRVILTAKREVSVDFGFSDVIVSTLSKDTPVAVRMHGFDTPELNDKRPAWKKAAYLAKDAARKWLDAALEAERLKMRSYRDKTGKFGRYLANFERHDQAVSTLKDFMLANHLAVAYEGQSKDSIAAAHQ
ncbi:MAG: hypothetical protein OXC93_12035, partial [Rhodospirillaceae bacterium]|nr:hypothetical protein [Rhodospirillaceae bacterium]